MQHRGNLPIPETLADVCDRDHLALLVYDMQVGVVGQLAGGPQVIEAVRRVLDAARGAGVRVYFTRHMTLPTELLHRRWVHLDTAASSAGRRRRRSRSRGGVLCLGDRPTRPTEFSLQPARGEGGGRRSSGPGAAHKPS